MGRGLSRRVPKVLRWLRMRIALSVSSASAFNSTVTSPEMRSRRQLRIARLHNANVLDDDKRRLAVGALFDEAGGICHQLGDALSLAADDFERLPIDPRGEANASVLLVLGRQTRRIALLADVDAVHLRDYLANGLS